ncbi:hypothetical protein CDAR_441411 [Caerostris darwini]|uniref:Uncharacterized protein n=1 Tax=Caerostris darwini TaxID=1538125 RepID=A0AAV4TS28_9ARAC|nr:hypothetical protein CDAR_441411 [Caerostris darwini]
MNGTFLLAQRIHNSQTASPPPRTSLGPTDGCHYQVNRGMAGRGKSSCYAPTFSPGQLHEGNSKVEGNLTDSMYRNMFKVNTLAVLGDCLPMFSNIRITVVFGMGYV